MINNDELLIKKVKDYIFNDNKLNKIYNYKFKYYLIKVYMLLTYTHNHE